MKGIFFVSLISVSLVMSCNKVDNGKTNSTLNIVNGTVLSDSNESTISLSTVAINANNSKNLRLCSGTLIANKYVLTAAHCVYQQNNNELYVYFNNKLQKQGPNKSIKVSQVIVHDEYNSELGHDIIPDIALLELEEDAVQKRFGKPAAINNGKLTEGLAVVLAGYGENDSKDHGVLRFTSDSYISSIENTHMFKTSSKSSATTTCVSDSGGPIYFKTKDNRYILVGVISTGRSLLGYCLTAFGARNVNVSAFYSWIMNNISK